MARISFLSILTAGFLFSSVFCQIPDQSEISRLVGRGRAVPDPNRNNKDEAERESEPPVAILKQINEHNEDGSYTYGYEAADGSFKLETRFPDGLVQGKYGYIDIDTGELKVIEYGADMMGFQPVGDLPEGIIIPEPVFEQLQDDQGNPIPFEGDANNPPLPRQEGSVRLRPENRARTRTSGSVTPSQNRGQELEQPIVPRTQQRPRTNRPRPVPQQQAPRQPPPPPPSQPRPQQQRFQPPPSRQQPVQPASFHLDRFQTSFTRSERPRSGPPVVLTPTRPPRPAAAAPARPSRPVVAARPSRPAAPRAPAPTAAPAPVESDPLSALRAIAGNPQRQQQQQPVRRPRPQTPRRTPSRGGSSSNRGGGSFANFPARTASSSSSSSPSQRRQPPRQFVPAAAVAEPTEAPAARRPIRIRPRPQPQQQQVVRQPPSEPSFIPRSQAAAPPPPPLPAPEVSRPRFQPPPPQQRRPVVSTVDFDALIQEFTGRRPSSTAVAAASRQSSQGQQFPQFAAVPAVPGLDRDEGRASFSLVTGVY